MTNPKAVSKQNERGKRVHGEGPIDLAYETVMEFLQMALAWQRARQARSPTKVFGTAREAELVGSVEWYFCCVRTVEQLKELPAAVLDDLIATQERSLEKMARAILNGVGKRPQARRLRRKYLILSASTAQVTDQFAKVLIAHGMRRFDPDENEAPWNNPGVRRAMRPQSATSLRRVIAKGLGVDERTVRRQEKTTAEDNKGLDPRARKTAAERTLSNKKK